MSWLITNFIAAFLLPPLSLILLGATGIYFWSKRPLQAKWLTATSLILLWLLSTPLIAEFLLHQLEPAPLASSENAPAPSKPAQAIVILSAGSYFHAPEYGGDVIGDNSLVRARYAARLHRQTGLPILITGGSPAGTGIAEAVLIKTSLEQDFNIPVRWIEPDSSNTRDSAHLSYNMLKNENIQTIYLVTHAWHMPRARYIFETAGFQVIAAPTAFITRHHINALAFMPDANAMQGSRIFLHELIGLLWYQLKS